MTKVIFLNGISSSGKTSIVKAIQHISPLPFLHFGVDTLIDMMPSKWLSFNEKGKDGCWFESYENDYGKATSCHSGPYGEEVFAMGIKLVKTILDCNLNLILDEVVWEQEKLDLYQSILNEYKTTFIRIECSRESAQEREFLRGDREIGLANDQFDKLHLVKCNYDLKIDTDKLNSFKSAEQILSLIL
jgi:chloramphenicol 3-O phosphotransferase